MSIKVIKISQESHPEYFTKSYTSPLKKSWFDAWYRGMRASATLRKSIVAMLLKNEEFFKENPDYKEGALCGKLKRKD
jgi:hypothetical protein